MKQYLENIRVKLRATFDHLRDLPIRTKQLTSLGLTVAMLVALPLFVFTILNSNLNPYRKAASGEFPTPSPIASAVPETPIIKQENITQVGLSSVSQNIYQRIQNPYSPLTIQLEKAQVFLTSSSGKPSQAVINIFKDNGGVPGDLIGKTENFTVLTDLNPAWFTTNLQSNVAIADKFFFVQVAKVEDGTLYQVLRKTGKDENSETYTVAASAKDKYCNTSGDCDIETVYRVYGQIGAPTKEPSPTSPPTSTPVFTSTPNPTSTPPPSGECGPCAPINNNACDQGLICQYGPTKCEVGGKCYPPEYGTCVKSDGTSNCGGSPTPTPTPKPSPTDFPYGTFVISSVTGQKSTYKPGEKISLSIDVTEEFDGSAAEEEEGFGVQVYTMESENLVLIATDAYWTGKVWEASLEAPNVIGNQYRIWVNAYCFGDCVERYGTNPAKAWIYPFQVKAGNVPRFIPQAFGRGRLNRNYATNIRGYDFDRNDLTDKSMTITGGNLPKGLTFGNCTVSNVILSSIVCRLRGRPLETGIFNITLSLSDKTGNTTNRALRLTVTR